LFEIISQDSQPHPQRMNTMETSLETKLDKKTETHCCCFCACVDEAVKYKQTTCINMLKFLESSIIPTPYLFKYLTEHSKRLMQAAKKKRKYETHVAETSDDAYDDEVINDSTLELFTLCVNCDSWIRRQTNKVKSLLHADAVFLNILFPGRFELPEERSCIRVVHNACICNEGFNFLQSIGPVAAKEFFAVFSAKYLFETNATVSAKENLTGVETTVEHWHVLSPNHNVASTQNKCRRNEHKSHIKNKLVYIWWQRNRRCEFLSNKYTAKHLRHIVHGMP
jgi:hypothetical protein